MPGAGFPAHQPAFLPAIDQNPKEMPRRPQGSLAHGRGTRAPLGIVVRDLPTLATLVVMGGISYWYLNGVHYREHATGGYEVVANPAWSFGSATSQSGFDPVPVAAGQAANDASRADDVRAQTACWQGCGYSVR
jgi:hypothetical protein